MPRICSTRPKSHVLNTFPDRIGEHATRHTYLSPACSTSVFNKSTYRGNNELGPICGDISYVTALILLWLCACIEEETHLAPEPITERFTEVLSPMHVLAPTKHPAATTDLFPSTILGCNALVVPTTANKDPATHMH